MRATETSSETRPTLPRTWLANSWKVPEENPLLKKHFIINFGVVWKDVSNVWGSDGITTAVQSSLPPLVFSRHIRFVTCIGEFGSCSSLETFSFKSTIFIAGLKGVENVYTQHQPCLRQTLDELFKVGLSGCCHFLLFLFCNPNPCFFTLFYTNINRSLTQDTYFKSALKCFEMLINKVIYNEKSLKNKAKKQPHF